MSKVLIVHLDGVNAVEFSQIHQHLASANIEFNIIMIPGNPSRERVSPYERLLEEAEVAVVVSPLIASKMMIAICKALESYNRTLQITRWYPRDNCTLTEVINEAHQARREGEEPLSSRLSRQPPDRKRICLTSIVLPVSSFDGRVDTYEANKISRSMG